MTVAEITPEMMLDRADEATNEDSGRRAGRVDAIIHISWLVTMHRTIEDIESFQTANMDPAVSSEHYIAGYSAAWKALYHMI